MGNQDFLISFSVDGTQAIRMMEQIGQRATALEARLNALGRGSGGAGSMGGNILTNLGLGSAQVGASTRAMSDLEARTVSLKNHVAELASARQAAATLGYAPNAGLLRTESIATQQLAQNYGALAKQYGVTTVEGRIAADQSAHFSRTARQLTADSKLAANQLDDTGQAFGRHTRRIFEAILIYEAFGRAVQAVQAGVALIIDIDRESRRLEAVLDIDPTRGAQFVQDLGEIASKTITPWAGLVSETDRMAAAFLDVEDPIKRAADTLLFANNAGKFTTVTQRGLGTEVTNLIAIMKQLNIPVEDLDDFLGKIVVAGGSASTVIAGLSDSLQISSRAAKAAGVDLDLLLASESAFLIKTGRTGSEVGNTFTIFFQRLRDPAVIDSVDKITNGLLKMRDAAGAIRDPFQILLELDALAAKKLITPTQKVDVLAALAPPLQPQRQFDFELILEQLKELGPRFKEVSQAGSSALDELNEKINSALGKQFEKLVTDAQRAFVDLFQEGILAGGQQFIDVIRAIGDILGKIPPQVLTAVIGFTSLMVAWRLLAFAGKGVMTLLGMGGLSSALATASSKAALAGTSFTTFGKTITAGKFLIGGLISQLVILAPLVAAWMAIDFVGKANEMQAGLRTQVGGQIEGKNLEELKAFRAKVQAEKDKLDQSGTLNPFDIPQMIGAAIAANTLGDSLKEIDAIIAGVVARGGAGVATINDLSDAFGGLSAEASADQVVLKEQIGVFEERIRLANEMVDALAGQTEAEKNAFAAATNTKNLTDEISSALGTLRDRYRDGAISAQEYATGQDQVARASELAGQLVAATKDQLKEMPLLAAAAAAGDDELTAAIFDLIVQAGDSMPVLEAQIQRILGTGAAAAAAAELARNNPIIISTFVLPPQGGSALNFSGKIGAMIRQDEQRDAPANSAAAIAKQILDGLSGLFRTLTRGSSTAFGTGPAFADTSAAAGPSANVIDIGDLPVEQLAQAIAKAQALQSAMPGANAAAADSILNIIKDAAFLQQVVGLDDALLREAITELTEVEKARLEAIDAAEKARLDSLKSTLVDVGDMPAEKLAEAITRGRALQAAIPGADELAKTSVLSVIKDAAFLQQVVGLDDTLLRKAIEELADIEKARLDEEKRQSDVDAILSNLSVLSGPMGALISAPTLFGAGGSIPAGMNFDPNNNGAFVVNIDIGEVSNLTPEQISTLIENAVRNAIQSALHQQGG